MTDAFRPELLHALTSDLTDDERERYAERLLDETAGRAGRDGAGTDSSASTAPEPEPTEDG